MFAGHDEGGGKVIKKEWFKFDRMVLWLKVLKQLSTNITEVIADYRSSDFNFVCCS